jgi:HD-GYP domain-containing protein (c-di-GMP phosphodiesterase class II)
MTYDADILRKECESAVFNRLGTDSRLKASSIGRTIDFVYLSTQNFDRSHDYVHAVRVMLWSVLIADEELRNYDFELLTASALLHDVRDHKYPDSISEEALRDFI